jgi:hypothetical protein
MVTSSPWRRSTTVATAVRSSPRYSIKCRHQAQVGDHAIGGPLEAQLGGGQIPPIGHARCRALEYCHRARSTVRIACPLR